MLALILAVYVIQNHARYWKFSLPNFTMTIFNAADSGKLIVHSVKISFDFDNKRIPSNLSLSIQSHPTKSCQRKRLVNWFTENSICPIWNFELKDEQVNLRFVMVDSCSKQNVDENSIWNPLEDKLHVK